MPDTLSRCSPFGFGLSYTTFALTHLTISPEGTKGDVHVSLTVTNTGPAAGSDVAQVYIADPASAGEPPHQLKGFVKIDLKPHESKQVALVLGPRAFSIWDVAANRWKLLPGQYGVFAGDSSRNLPLRGSVTVHPAGR